MTNSTRRAVLCRLLALAAIPSATASAQGTYPFEPAHVNELELTFTEDVAGLGAIFWEWILSQYSPNFNQNSSTTADLRVNGEPESYPVEVEYRGNTSYSFSTSTCGPYGRKPLKIKAVDDAWASLDRMRFNVTADYLDLSFMTEVMTRNILGRFTIAQRQGLVRISVGPNYFMAPDEYLSMGMYNYHEAIDKQFESRHFLGNEGIRFAITGAEQAQDWTSAEDTQASFHELGSNNDGDCAEAEAAYFADWDGVLPGPDTDTDCSWEELYGVGWVLEHLVPGTPEFAEEMERHLDVDQMLWALAAWHMLGDSDRMQVRFLEDSHHGRMAVIPYDVSHSIWPSLNNGSQNPFLSPADYRQSPELMDALLAHPQYLARYQHHIRLVYREAFTPAQFECIGEAYREVVTQNAGGIDGQDCSAGGYQYPPFAPDSAAAIAENSLTFDGPDDNGWQHTLSRYTERHGIMGSLVGATAVEPPIYPLPISPSQPVAGQPTVVTALAIGTQFPQMPEVALRWRVNGSYAYVPMLDDGMGADLAAGDFRFTAEIPPQAEGSVVEYYIESYDDAPSVPVMAFAPDRAAGKPETFHVASSWSTDRIVINEIMADPSTGAEFIELYNPTGATVDIGGWVVDDDVLPGPGDLDDDRFVFPASVTMAAGEYIVVWCGGDGTGWEAPFNLKNRGETVTIATSDASGNAISDVYRYSRPFEGVSVGRTRDGKDAWKPFPVPTPGATNGLVGDLNGDGALTATDLTALLSAYGTCGVGVAADLNGDFIVDTLDVDILVAIF